MLRYISVQNFAIIENIEVEFNKGMTALTGETGAGKSLLIDAIGLLLGDRATSNVVRTGESKAVVEGVFKYESNKIKKHLIELDLDNDDNELVIRRQITPSNNNVIKVNGQTVTLSQLREITNLLADIHTQHDTHRLINTETYLDIIDGFKSEETNELIEIYKKSLTQYKLELKELNRLYHSNDEMLEKLDLMKFQKEELERYNLDVEEEKELEETVEKMENFDKIFTALNEAKSLLQETNAIDRIYDASKGLEAIEDYNNNYGELKSRIQSSYFELSDAFEELQGEIDSLDFNPRLLDTYQDRLNSLSSLKRKYRKELPELIDYLDKITKDINNIDNIDEVIKDQEHKTITAYKAVKQDASNITDLRRKTSDYIEEELLSILSDLELKKAQFKIEFINEFNDDYKKQSQFLENGIDEVDFLITTNVGEPLKSLSKSASGGEMSRIMLGLKNLLVQSLQLSLIIFDEIDTGVSGYVASQVAKKMVEISKQTQVICITHIPQVAATSDHHLFISKSVEDGRTKAHIKALMNDEKIKEIATMISGDTVTDASIQSAKELLK